MKTEHGEIIIYEAEGGKSSLEVHLHEETVRLSLNQMAELFDRNKSVVSRHLNNIFKSGELLRNSVVAKNATTAAVGKIYQVDYYNLGAIISVGYRLIQNGVPNSGYGPHPCSKITLSRASPLTSGAWQKKVSQRWNRQFN